MNIREMPAKNQTTNIVPNTLRGGSPYDKGKEIFFRRKVGEVREVTMATETFAGRAIEPPDSPYLPDFIKKQ